MVPARGEGTPRPRLSVERRAREAHAQRSTALAGRRFGCPCRWPAATRPDPTPTADYSPSLRSPWLVAYVPSTSQLNDPFEFIVKLDTRDHGKERTIQKNITARARVLSFSGGQDSAKNILMWSHYADSHRGACLQFDTRKWDPRKYRPGYVVRNVRYSMRRPLVSLSRKAQQNTELLNKIAFTKHKNWYYEQEWRG